MDEYNLTYSQNREDLIIRAFLKNIKKGFYVDVGANHPTIDSVTKVFYDEGWKGINIEPNKTLNKLLKDERPNDINLQIGVSDKPGQLVLRSYDIGHGLSTFSKEMQKDYTEHPSRVTKEYHDYKVDTLPLKDIFDKYNVPQINFMKIDVEGYEYEVIDSNDWAKYRPQVLCIEANHMIKNWKPLLAKAKYELVYFDGLNNYYLSKECISLKENFSYVNDLLLGKPIIKADVFNELKDLEESRKNIDQLRRDTELKLINQELVNQNLTAEIHAINAKIQEQKRIRSLVKQLARSINAAILLNIENLNKLKINNENKLLVNKSDDPEALIEQIKIYDISTYYNYKKKNSFKYVLVSSIYKFSYRALRQSFIYSIKVIRK